MNTDELRNIVQTVGGLFSVVFVLVAATLVNCIFWQVDAAVFVWGARVGVIALTIMLLCWLLESALD